MLEPCFNIAASCYTLPLHTLDHVTFYKALGNKHVWQHNTRLPHNLCTEFSCS